MAYEFLEELTEARYVRNDRDIRGRDEKDISESFFQHMLILQQMRFEQPDMAREYATDTLRFMQFSAIRPGGTDLHNLAAILNNPDKFADKIGGTGSVRFDSMNFRRWLRDISRDRLRTSEDRRFFLKMQKDLRIRNSLLVQARRLMADYATANPTEKKSVNARMIAAFRKGPGQIKSDIFKPWAKTVKDMDGKGGKASGALKIAGAAAAGGLAGFWFGRKFG